MRDILADNENLKKEFKDSVDAFEPINHRRYTFIDSDEEETLSVGLRYDFQRINSNRNEILGEWALTEGKYNLYFQIYLDTKTEESSVGVRNAIMRSNLTSSIRKIIRADKKLMERHSFLNDSPVIVYFRSSLPYYNKIENWGVISNYLNDDNIEYINYNKAESEILKVLMIPVITSEIKNVINDIEDIKNVEIVDIQSVGLDFEYSILVKFLGKKKSKTINLLAEFDVTKEEVKLNKFNEIES